MGRPPGRRAVGTSVRRTHFPRQARPFLPAFAARYDGKRGFAGYLDVGSIGDWGEGHCWAGSRKDLSFAVRKEHVGSSPEAFQAHQLVISDDTSRLERPRRACEAAPTHSDQGISYATTASMVDGYFAGTSDRFTVRSPEFFEDAFRRTPTVFELEHYG